MTGEVYPSIETVERDGVKLRVYGVARPWRTAPSTAIRSPDGAGGAEGCARQAQRHHQTSWLYARFVEWPT
jgi:hypothetical protein